MSKPRIFVSSTYYDLRYVRERIENFIKAYCFEPILFESDGVYFHPDKPLDASCYNEIANCHMMILIIGGRYGSLATEGNKEKRKENYEKQYVSITRKEYETARKKGIPVMIFVEQNVYTEYRTYQTNKSSIPPDFKFAYVDDIRIFDFISSLEQNAIKQFNKVDDIEHYFANQIAGMLLSYLIQLQDEKEDKDMQTAVGQLNVISQSMQTMLNNIGEKILGGDDTKYTDLLAAQNKSLIDFFIELFDKSVSWSEKSDNNRSYSNEICDILMTLLFNKERLDAISENDNILKEWSDIRALGQICTDEIQKKCSGLIMNIPTLSFHKQLVQIVNLIDQNEGLKNYFKDNLKQRIALDLSLPF